VHYAAICISRRTAYATAAAVAAASLPPTATNRDPVELAEKLHRRRRKLRPALQRPEQINSVD